QGHGIEGEAEKVHDGDGAEQRDRYGGGNDERGTEGAQEQPDDKGGQQRAFDQVLLQRPHDFLDIQGVIGGNVDTQTRRQAGPDFLIEPALHLFNNGDGVGIGNLDNPQAYSRLAVVVRELAIVFETVFQLGDILQLDRRTVPVSHHKAGKLSHIVEFEIELDHVFGFFAHQEAARQLNVFPVESLDHIGGNDVVCRHAFRQHIDTDIAVAAAAEPYLAYAINGFELFLDDIEAVEIELLQRAVAAQGQPHDGPRVGLHLAHNGRIDL